MLQSNASMWQRIDTAGRGCKSGAESLSKREFLFNSSITFRQTECAADPTLFLAKGHSGASLSLMRRMIEAQGRL